MKTQKKLTPLGVAVKKRLIEVGKSQRQLAEELGTSSVYLSYIFYGERSGEKYLEDILRLLDLDRNMIA